MMNDTRYKNLYDAYLSHINFSNYIESYGEDEVDLTKINYNLLIALFSSFYFTIALDKYIEKVDGADPIVKIVPEFLDEVVSLFAGKYGTGWKLGELSYKNSSVVIDKVRNKLAHGDYIVENGYIIFNENKLEGRIHVDNLIKAIAAIDAGIKTYKQEGESTTINACLKYVENRSVHGEPSFKKYCKDFIVMFVNDEPLPGRNRSVEYVTFLEKIKKRIFELFQEDELNDTRIKKYLEKNKPLLELYGISLNYNICTAYDLDYYEELKNYYFETNEYSKEFQGSMLGRYLINKILKLSKGRFQTFNASKGTYVDLALLKMFRDNPGITLWDIPKLYPELSGILIDDIDNAIIATNLVGFNSFYQFGLEKGLTNKGQYDLAKIVNYSSLDFSKLDLDLLDDPNMVIEHKFECYHSDIQKYKDKEPGLKNRVEVAREVIQKYLDHTADEDLNQDRLNILRDRYYQTLTDYNNNQALINNMEYFYSNFDHDKYVRNINIIEHVRNAISHGNVFVDEYEKHKDIINKTIIIKDYDLDGNIVYDKTLTMYEFASIFKMKNFYVLNGFITHNIEDKSLVDDSFVEELNRRIDNRKR